MIGEKIRTIRTIKGYSQEYMSNILNISQPAYSDIEKNKTKIDINRLKKISEILEIDINELLNFDEKYIFNNTFNENSKGFFNVKKIINDTFDSERTNFMDKIEDLKKEIHVLNEKLELKKKNIEK